MSRVRSKCVYEIGKSFVPDARHAIGDHSYAHTLGKIQVEVDPIEKGKAPPREWPTTVTDGASSFERTIWTTEDIFDAELVWVIVNCM